MTHTIPLNSGTTMPVLGLGTWETSGEGTYHAVRLALDLGYRHLDTATFFGNEAPVGRAVRNSGIDRAEIFVTTKMPPADAGRERQTLQQSLRESGLDYFDLWLVHWPPGGAARAATWEKFIDARRGGAVHAIGVSNYSLAQIDELSAATGVTPEGWAPLKSTDLAAAVLTDIADRHGVTAAQVVLRWHIQHDVVVIPKSTSPQRLALNIDVFGFGFGFRLSPSEMTAIDTIALVSEPVPALW
ncbi:aldo/keto reductase [Rhodococcus sp. NPDC127530]|uniref:aldo/keto reductase n=1 Tax=unclassified Rhodococcus (in: high G+C Gram-positive bacteria) TaxID=192944 RepID=UPI0036280E82